MEATRKKTLALFMCVSMLAVALVGGTMAYLTDTDSDVNVMTVGNVEIEQIEQQRAADGTLEDFDQGQKMLPATSDPAYNDAITVGGVEYNAMNVGSEIDKIVTVANTGSEDAWVRTIFAFEHSDPNGDGNYEDGIAWKLHAVYNGADAVDGKWETYSGELDNITINGKVYSLATFTYKDKLAAGETSAPSLLQVFFDKSVTNEDLEAVGDEYDILVLSQAIQAEGFEDAKTALTAGFGSVTPENAKAWFTGSEFAVPEVASTQDELNQLLASGADKIVLAGDTEYVLPTSVEGTEFIGGKVVMDAPATSAETDVITAGAGTTFTNVEFEINDETGTGSENAAFVRVAGAGVTFDGCSFDISGTNMTAVEIGGGADGTVVKDCEFVGGFKHIGPGSGIPSDTVIDGCTFSGQNSSYAIHMNVTTGDLVVKNSEIALFSTLFGHGGDTGKLVFENCDFVVESGKTNVVKLYRDAEFVNCDFEDGFLFSDANKPLSVSFVGGSWGAGSIKDHFLADKFGYDMTASFDGEVWLFDADTDTWTRQ